MKKFVVMMFAMIVMAISLIGCTNDTEHTSYENAIENYLYEDHGIHYNVDIEKIDEKNGWIDYVAYENGDASIYGGIRIWYVEQFSEV